jgi:hypothetical protein
MIGRRIAVWEFGNPSPTYDSPDFICTVTGRGSGTADYVVEGVPHKGVNCFQWNGSRRPDDYRDPTGLVFSGYLYARKKSVNTAIFEVEFKILPPDSAV